MRISEREAPNWLNSTFFLDILQSREGSQVIKINSTYVDCVTSSSDAYASRIFRVTINYDSKFAKNVKSHWIAKIPCHAKVNLMDTKCFETERMIYNDTIPQIQRLMKHGDENVIFTPSMIHYSAEPNYVLLLDDMQHNGYEPLKNTLNIDGTIKVLRKLAKWHAASYNLSTDHENHITEYKSGLFNYKYNEPVCFMQDNIRIFSEEVKNWPGYESYSEKILRFAQSLQENGAKIYASSDTFNVLNHGDLSISNLLAKKENNSVEDVIFVDLQLAVWASPAIDINYVLYLVASPDVRNRFRNQLIDYYYNEFVNTLKNIGNLKRAPSKLDLQCELLKNGFMEVVIAIAILPLSMMNHTDHHHGDMRKEAFNNPKYQEIIKDLLPRFLKKGLIH